MAIHISTRTRIPWCEPMSDENELKVSNFGTSEKKLDLKK